MTAEYVETARSPAVIDRRYSTPPAFMCKKPPVTRSRTTRIDLVAMPRDSMFRVGPMAVKYPLMPQRRKEKRKGAATAKRAGVDPYVATLLEKITTGKQQLLFRKGKKIYSQGDPADSIYFIQSGRIKIGVVSAAGKEAVLAMPGPHDFFGEGSLVKQSLRVSTAVTLEPCAVFRIEKRAMIRALHEQSELSEKFMASLLARNIDLEEDLCDQLFNHSEKRLARVLLKLARLRETDLVLDASVPVLSHETLAEMVGTTRARITHFMNKFRTMGLIDYNGELTIRTELLTDLLLHD
jgi:CRP/FNR family transcriptional regulator, cyclic AMP receptor protein